MDTGLTDADADAVARRYGLGRRAGPLVPVSGGLLNRLWRLTTEQGDFAVKELNLDRDWFCDHEAVLELERAAFSAGVPMPEPVPDPGGRALVVLEGGPSVVVHRWIDGGPVPTDAPISEPLATGIGGALATIHRLGLDWRNFEHQHNPLPREDDWRSLAEEARTAGMRWADDLDRAAPALHTLRQWVEEVAARDDPLVLCHRDINQKNLLDLDGRPVILDWEAAGPTSIGSDLGGCLNMAVHDEHLRRPVAAALLGAYADAGGTIPEFGIHWLVQPMAGGVWFLRWNVLRCLAGRESSGQPLTVSHRVIHQELRAIPQALRSIDERLAVIGDLLGHL